MMYAKKSGDFAPRTRSSYMERKARPVAGERFQATCANCSAKCEVPFKPNGKKPIYCRDCFKDQDGGLTRGAALRRDDSSGSLTEQLKQVNAKLDRLLRAVEGRGR